MQTHYDYYLLGCRQAGVRPLSFWRFHVAYAKYQRDFRRALDRRVDLLTTKRRERIVDRWTWLVRLAELVESGREIAERAARIRGDDDEPGTAGAGMREPRVPRTPVLVGCAAHAMPKDDVRRQNDEWRL